MHGLVEASPQHRGATPRDHVAVALAPGCVGDLGEDRLNALPVSGYAVVEAHRVKTMPERTQLGEHADRTGRARPGVLGDGVAHRVGQRRFAIAVIVAPAE